MLTTETLANILMDGLSCMAISKSGNYSEDEMHDIIQEIGTGCPQKKFHELYRKQENIIKAN